MGKRLTDLRVKNIKPPATGQRSYFDGELVLRVSHGGTKAWRAVYYRDGKPKYIKLGRYPEISLSEARSKAREKLEEVEQGDLPSRDTVAAVVEKFMAREGSKNRTAGETQRIFDTNVLPQWGKKLITEVRRRDVNDLLDKIEDGKLRGKKGQQLRGGPVMADRTLAAISRLFNWFAIKDERFRSPLVRGMNRSKARERARKRVLSDDEIRIIWPLLETSGIFGHILKVLFLTAQRRSDIADMRRTEIDKEGVLTIPGERYKNKQPHYVPLTDTALAIINEQPQIEESDYVFTLNGENPFDGFSKCKARLHDAILKVMRQQATDAGKDPTKVKPLTKWTIHDIRRTCKTLMSRAGVRPDISERVLGHVIPGVEGVYDRYDYLAEKKDALEKLAKMIDRIVHPAENVVEMKPVGRKRVKKA